MASQVDTELETQRGGHSGRARPRGMRVGWQDISPWTKLSLWFYFVSQSMFLKVLSYFSEFLNHKVSLKIRISSFF